jgi:hypothetical protein
MKPTRPSMRWRACGSVVMSENTIAGISIDSYGVSMFFQKSTKFYQKILPV